MAWFKVDDGFWSHPKTMRLRPEAISLWVRAGTWSCQQLTDGFIPDYVLPMFAISGWEPDDLVAVGYWDRDDRGGFRFHDWDDYQEPSEKVKERRAAARERMRKVRANKTRTDDERSPEQSGWFAGSSLNPDPTRPDPTLSTSNEVERPLSPFCSKHPNGTERACRACGVARMSFEAVKASEKNKPTPIVRKPATCSIHAEYPLPCPRCAEDEAVAS